MGIDKNGGEIKRLIAIKAVRGRWVGIDNQKMGDKNYSLMAKGFPLFRIFSSSRLLISDMGYFLDKNRNF